MHEQIRSSAVLFISESNPTENEMALARNLGAEIVRADDLQPFHSAPDPTFVFDVDLQRVDRVNGLKKALPQRGQGCRVFLVNPDVRVTGVHAKVLGADVLLARPTKADDIHAAIRKHFGIAGNLDDPEVIESIEAGVGALDESFKAFSDNRELNTESVISSGEKIADAISHLGFEDWLATVKGYHMGTFQHCMLVTGVATAFGTKTGMARRDVVKLAVAGLLHDIGKAAVPIAILDKPGALTPEEMKVIQLHPVAGYDYLVAKSSVSADVLRSVRHHHEHLDGRGYPDGLSGNQIDDVTRIITICDIYAALIERRSYKAPTSPAQALMIMNAMAGAGKIEDSLVRELSRIFLPSSS